MMNRYHVEEGVLVLSKFVRVMIEGGRLLFLEIEMLLGGDLMVDPINTHFHLFLDFFFQQQQQRSWSRRLMDDR